MGRQEDKSYQVCSRTVMDTSDSRITFDASGVCDHAIDFDRHIKPFWPPDASRRALIEQEAVRIRKHGRHRDFDCILGLSGGVDSSYMLHLAVRELGLRPLVFHVDGGWNSELAVHNIHALVDKLGLDLFTEVIDWEEMRQFQLAWFRAGVPHLDIPQDHAFVATLYNFADKHRIHYILNGGNISTECVRNPMEFFYYGTDMVHIRDIMRRFCRVRLKRYPFSSVLRHKVYLRYLRGVRVVRPLNFVPYSKSAALDLLHREYGWKPYPQKHFESRFTRFLEGHWLPNRFGFDTRRVQFSSLILTGQMTREDALARLESPALDPDTVRLDLEYIAAKLQITPKELDGFFNAPKRFYWDYHNQERLFNAGARILKAVGIEASIKR
jgi:N-acetyl sugar amidotransferase